jgi:hypothetical protein
MRTLVLPSHEVYFLISLHVPDDVFASTCGAMAASCWTHTRRPKQSTALCPHLAAWLLRGTFARYS